MTNLGVWLGMGATVIAAVAFLSHLIYIGATSAGHPAREVWGTLGLIWLCLVAAIVTLAGARVIMGGTLVEYTASQGGLHLGSARPISYYAPAGALVVVGLLLYVALRAARRLQEPPDADGGPGDNSPPSVEP